MVKLTFIVDKSRNRMTVHEVTGETNPSLYDRKIDTFESIANCINQAVEIARQ